MAVIHKFSLSGGFNVLLDRRGGTAVHKDVVVPSCIDSDGLGIGESVVWSSASSCRSREWNVSGVWRRCLRFRRYDPEDVCTLYDRGAFNTSLTCPGTHRLLQGSCTRMYSCGFSGGSSFTLRSWNDFCKSWRYFKLSL